MSRRNSAASSSFSGEPSVTPAIRALEEQLSPDSDTGYDVEDYYILVKQGNRTPLYEYLDKFHRIRMKHPRVEPETPVERVNCFINGLHYDLWVRMQKYLGESDFNKVVKAATLCEDLLLNIEMVIEVEREGEIKVPDYIWKALKEHDNWEEELRRERIRRRHA